MMSNTWCVEYVLDIDFHIIFFFGNLSNIKATLQEWIKYFLIEVVNLMFPS